MKTQQTLTRATEIDIGHRVMDEPIKCFNLHGHRMRIEMTFSFETVQKIGYFIDFKDLKRIGCAWIDEHLDHAFAANPADTEVIKTCETLKSRLYLMSLNGKGVYCNPTAENLSKEIFLAIELLFEAEASLTLTKLRLYETPNCWVDTYQHSINETERAHFLAYREASIRQWLASR